MERWSDTLFAPSLYHCIAIASSPHCQRPIASSLYRSALKASLWGYGGMLEILSKLDTIHKAIFTITH